MRTLPIRENPDVRLHGRFDPAQPDFPMMWTGAGTEMLATAGTLEVRILCGYRTLRPYLSFEVDGLRAQTFSPLPGAHWYAVMLGMDPAKAHRVRITLETQAFSADPDSYVALSALRTDGTLAPVPARARRVEFIGDSITSGEGMRGPKDFMEWVPMCFSASDNYTRLTAERLHADYQVVSQSGWGVLCGWNNDPATNLPDVYDAVCLPAAMESADGTAHGGEKPYAFTFDPDAVVVHLGTNDASALHNPPYTNPKTGDVFRFTEAMLPLYEERCLAFLLHLHAKNPRARLFWAYGVVGDALAAPIRSAVARAGRQGVDATYLPLPDMRTLREGIGSREHPGPGAARRMAEIIADAVKGK